jgi:hypothetical protein
MGAVLDYLKALDDTKETGHSPYDVLTTGRLLDPLQKAKASTSSNCLPQPYRLERNIMMQR